MSEKSLDADEEADLERFEEKQVKDYFQYAFDADTNLEADEAVKELLKIKIKVQLDLQRPRRRVVSSVSGSVGGVSSEFCGSNALLPFTCIVTAFFDFIFIKIKSTSFI